MKRIKRALGPLICGGGWCSFLFEGGYRTGDWLYLIVESSIKGGNAYGLRTMVKDRLIIKI